MPFGTLFDVCRPFLDSIGDLPDRQRRALEGALAMGPAAEGDRFAIGAATLSLLAADARDTPLLLVIDDAQWVDDGVGGVARLRATAPRRRRHRRAVGMRTGERGWVRRDRVPDARGRSADHRRCRRARGLEATGLAASRRSGSHSASGGNPLAVLELVGSETSVLDGLVPIPAHIERTFAARVEELPEDDAGSAAGRRRRRPGADRRDRAGDIARGARPRRGRGSGADRRGAARVSPSAGALRDLPARVTDRATRSPRGVGGGAPAGAGVAPGVAPRRRRWSSRTRASRRRWRQVAVEAQERRGPAAAAAAWRRAAELTPDAEPAGATAAGRERSRMGGRGERRRAARRPTRRWRPARTRCCTPTSFASASGSTRSRAGSPRRSRRRCRRRQQAVAPLDSLRAAYLLADAVTRVLAGLGHRAERRARAGCARRGRRAATTRCSTTSWASSSPAKGRSTKPRGSSDAAERAIVGDPKPAIQSARDCIPGGRLRVVAQRPAVVLRSSAEAVDRARELGLAGVVAAGAGRARRLADRSRRLGRGRSGTRRGDPAGRGHRTADQRRRSALSRQAEIAARRGDAERFEELNAAAARYAGTAAPIQAFERNSRCLLALGTGPPRARDREPRTDRALHDRTTLRKRA